MLEAVGETLLVKRIETPKKPSLIITAQSGPIMAEIMSVGEHVKGAYKPGDLIYMDDLAGIRLEADGEKVLIIYEKQILARLLPSYDDQAKLLR